MDINEAKESGFELLRFLQIPKTGRVIDLDSGRWPGMPLWNGHPPFQLLTYRTPRGIRNQNDQEWLRPENNEINFGLISEVMIATCHSGTHIDALAHATVGPDNHWNNGISADDSLGDFGPLSEDATEIPAMIKRGVLLDIAAAKGLDRLPAGYGISARDVQEALDAQAISLESGDVVLVRTGQMSVWPNQEEMAKTKGSGITIEAAEFLLSHGAVAVGVDTESCEVVPNAIQGNPHPVHERLLIEAGVYIIENIYLEELSKLGAYEFLFIALPLKIRGATASMLRPVAIL